MYRKFNNQIKNDLIRTYCKNKVVFDIGAGVGGDLVKYEKSNVEFLYALEPDEKKIVEFKKRLPKDMKDKTEIIIAPGEEYIELEDVDVTVSMFSMSFFFESDQVLDKFIENIKGEFFIGTMLDGDKLKFNSGIIKGSFFEIKQLENNKISIYLNNTPTVQGVQIEWVSSFEKLKEKLKRRGYGLIDTRLFSKFIGFEDLKPDEKKLLSLYRTFVFSKHPDTLELTNVDTVSSTLLVKNLICYNCPDLHFLPDLYNLETLKLIRADVYLISHLINLKELIIENCENIKKIPVLRKLKILICTSCDLLEDIPILDSLETLKLENCNNIFTINSYKKLYLLSNKNIKKILKNKNINNLSIINCNPELLIEDDLFDLKSLECDNPKFLSKGKTVTTLFLHSIPDTQIIETFKNLKILSFDNCNAFIPTLNLEELIINECPNVEFIPKLDKLKTLKCIRLEKLQSLPDFDNLISLECILCEKLVTLPKNNVLQELYLEKCSGVEKLPKIRTISYLHCEFCPKIESVFIYAENGVLIFNFCINLRFIRVYSTMLEEIRCSFCPELSYILLNDTQKLKIIDSKSVFVPKRIREKFNIPFSLDGILSAVLTGKSLK